MNAKNDWFDASCGMEFVCPKQWSALKPTDDEAVRFCDKCEQNVHLVGSEVEFRKQAAAGRCVAVLVDENISIVGGTSVVYGRSEE